jgi:hypothetical protein
MARPAALLAAALLLAPVLMPEIAEARGKGGRQQEERVGVVAGTVFQDSGFALSGARVTLAPEGKSEHAARIKPQETTTDRRGEFAFRVPAGSMRYTVRVEAEGWAPAEKSVEVEWDQRLDVSFRLRPAASGESRK